MRTFDAAVRQRASPRHSVRGYGSSARMIDDRDAKRWQASSLNNLAMTPTRVPTKQAEAMRSSRPQEVRAAYPPGAQSPGMEGSHNAHRWAFAGLVPGLA